MAKNDENKALEVKWYGCSPVRLNVRKAADFAAETIYEPPVYVEPGEKFGVLEEKGDWLKTEKGWILKQDIIEREEKEEGDK